MSALLLVFFFISAHSVGIGRAEDDLRERLTQAVIVVGELEARVAQTVVGPDSVLTSPVSTGVPLTLINIYQEELNVYLELAIRP